ncbi:hypothetical protein COO60DRAFT_141153 [Scenedesmus sp. NREL 46B-D3]|nr:hypothetical protein COO60DRAFT_141153 [Scenedesmus sp. NREL 46B-D3]
MAPCVVGMALPTLCRRGRCRRPRNARGVHAARSRQVRICSSAGCQRTQQQPAQAFTWRSWCVCSTWQARQGCICSSAAAGGYAAVQARGELLMLLDVPWLPALCTSRRASLTCGALNRVLGMTRHDSVEGWVPACLFDWLVVLHCRHMSHWSACASVAQRRGFWAPALRLQDLLVRFCRR